MQCHPYKPPNQHHPFALLFTLLTPAYRLPHCRPVKPAGHTGCWVEMSALEELVRPCDGDEFDDIDALLHALDNWAVKDKFTFRTVKRENGRAV